MVINMKPINNLNDIIDIPFTRSMYLVDKYGTIYDKTGNQLTHDGLEDSILNGIDRMAIAWIAFYGWYIPPSQWVNLTAHLISNGDTVDCYTIGIKHRMESLDYPGYYLIPGYSDYLITDGGRVYRRRNMTEVTPSLAATGYYTLRMKDDRGCIGNRLRHRIVAMSFIPCRGDFDTMTVNHINMVRGDDKVDNLEWVTLADNIRHGRINGSTGLKYPPIEIRDTLTNEIFQFDIYTKAAEFLGISVSTLMNWVKHGDSYSRRGYQLRYLTDKALPWSNVARMGSGFLVYPPDSRSAIICNGENAAKMVGITRTSLSRSLRNGRTTINGFNVLRQGQHKPI